MKRIKNIVIYFFVLIIIIASFKIPEILIEMENTNIEIAVYEKEKKKNAIDIEAEKIYLVKTIHDIESERSLVKISSSGVDMVFLTESNNNKNMSANIYNELLKLNEYSILKPIEINESDKIEVGLTENRYRIENNEYYINSVLLKIDNEQYMFEIENKTGKILNIVIPKDNLYNANKEEIMKNYVEYLDLYIIDDWKFEENIISSEKYYWKFANNMLKSEKAGLVVNLVENEDNYILSIHSSERISDMLQ